MRVRGNSIASVGALLLAGCGPTEAILTCVPNSKICVGANARSLDTYQGIKKPLGILAGLRCEEGGREVGPATAILDGCNGNLITLFYEKERKQFTIYVREGKIEKIMVSSGVTYP